jgi:arylsulfatase A-like enzyme
MLRSRGTSFLQTIATTTTTSPSVASMLTGLYPFGHGVKSLYGYKLNSSVATLPDILSSNAYNTYAEVTGPLMPQIGLNKGFTEYNLRERRESLYSAWYENLLSKFDSGYFKEPYFILIHLFELHRPRSIPDEYNTGKFGKNKYERALSGIDAQLKRVIDRLDENTIIIFHADHGEKIAENSFQEYMVKFNNIYNMLKAKAGFEVNRLPTVGHGFHVYDYLVRIPLIFVGKNIFPENKIITEQVRQIDISPTLLEALELKFPYNNIHGQSLMPLIHGKTIPEYPAYCESVGSILADKSRWLSAIRTPEYKYVMGTYSDELPRELYNLIKDPYEKNNIVHKEPDLAEKMERELLGIRRMEEKAKVKQRVKTLKALKSI